MKAQKRSRGIALLSPTFGATDSLQLMSEEELSSQGPLHSHIYICMKNELQC